MLDKAIFQLPGARRALAALVAFSLARALLTVGQAASSESLSAGSTTSASSPPGPVRAKCSSAPASITPV